MHAVGHKKNSTTKESRDFSFFSLFQQNEKNDKKKGIRAQNKFNCEIFWQKAKTERTKKGKMTSTTTTVARENRYKEHKVGPHHFPLNFFSLFFSFSLLK